MLGRVICSSFSVRRFFYSSSLAPQLFRLRDPSKAPDVIAKWKEEGHVLSSADIRTAVTGIINHGRYNKALGILDSLVKEKSVELGSQEYASHLSLIAKVRGLDSSEKYFEMIPKEKKDEFVHNALLEIYVKRRETAKAEALMEKMAGNGLLMSCRPYIQMMSLHMSNGKDDKVKEMIAEVKKHIQPKFRLYNMWLNACASANNVEAAEMVFSEMKEAKVEPTWLTHGILAGLYIKNKLFEKAASALKEKEDSIFSPNRNVYTSLISQHGHLGNKDAILRIWDKLKLNFNNLSDYEYSLIVSTLSKVDCYEKAEEIASEWTAAIDKRGGRGGSSLHRNTLELLRKAKDGSPPPSEMVDEESVDVAV